MHAGEGAGGGGGGGFMRRDEVGGWLRVVVKVQRVRS